MYNLLDMRNLDMFTWQFDHKANKRFMKNPINIIHNILFLQTKKISMIKFHDSIQIYNDSTFTLQFLSLTN